MLYEIKVLKAPWPKGAKVGDVIDMPYLPVWAQGKCNIALDGAEATIEFVEPVPGDGVSRPLDAKPGDQNPVDAEAIRAEIAELRQKLEASDKEKARLVGEIEASTSAHAGLQGERDAAAAEIAELRQKLEAAEQIAASASPRASHKRG